MELVTGSARQLVGVGGIILAAFSSADCFHDSLRSTCFQEAHSLKGTIASMGTPNNAKVHLAH